MTTSGSHSRYRVHSQHTTKGGYQDEKISSCECRYHDAERGGVGLKSQEANAAQVEGVTQAWDKNLPSASRFTVLAAFGGAAVRDNNTGLVLEQGPDATARPWGGATGNCVNKNVGGTRGWRLPSVAELASVLDGSPGAVAPFVPASVFTGVQSAIFGRRRLQQEAQ